MKRFFTIQDGDQEDQITSKTVERLIEFINSLNLKDEVIVTINSGGGHRFPAMQIVEILSELDNVTLAACGEVSSAALDIFIMTKCKKKRVTEMAFGIWHKLFSHQDFRPGISISQKRIKQEELLDSAQIDFMEKILPESEIRKYKQGKDVLLDSKDLTKLSLINIKKLPNK